MRPSVPAALLCAALAPLSALAADHVDSPATTADPTADITDIYAWMTPDAASLNLVMNVSPFAGEDAQFSTAVTYALHIDSSAGTGEAQVETLLRCKFYDESALECWVGDSYVVGDPSGDGITSDDGMMRVFAGLRDDPFFFELEGFRQAVAAVKAAAPSLTFDDHGCPNVDAGTSAALVAQLQSGPGGVPATDTFAGANVLSLVIQLDKSLVTTNGPLLGIWGSTHRDN